MAEFLENLENNKSIKEDDFYEISLSSLLSTILRSKKVVFASTFLGIFISIIYIIFRVPIYKGDFQIVLEDKSKRNLQNSSSAQLNLTSIVGSGLIKNSKSDLLTTTKILESSSVLTPIYLYVKEQKLLNKEKEPRSFKSWKKSFSVKLLKGTSVLQVDYKDSDKKLIEEVLNKVSRSFQEFSNRDRKRNREKTINLLNDQYSQMNKKTTDSLKSLQQYSIDNFLGLEDGLPALENEIDFSDFSISKEFQDLGNLSSKLADDLPANSNSDNKSRYRSHFSKLRRLEAELVNKSALLNENSPIIKSLKTQIKALKESISRPKDVLLTYRILKREAERNEKYLASLEKKILVYKLTEAQRPDPWELISTPTISEYPISWSKKIILLVGVIIGTIFGALVACIKESKSELVFNIEEYKKILKYKFLLNLPVNDSVETGELIKLVLKNFKETSEKNMVDMIYCGQKNNEDELFNFLNNIMIEIKNPLKRFNEIGESKNIILFVMPGKIKKSQLNYFIQFLAISKVNVIGWIYIDK